MTSFKSIIRCLFKEQKVALFKTLLINFKCLPLKQAVKLPIYVYAGTILKSMGDISIQAPITKGMIHIGVRQFFASGELQLINSGTIIFNGSAKLQGGMCINNSGVINLGSDVIVCENVTLLIINRLDVGSYSRIAFGTTILDTDFHSVININNGVVKRPYLPISIGKYTWIGNRSTITKGAIIPDYTIVSSTSYVNKDYSDIPPYSILAGSPAKLLASGFRRVYNRENAAALRRYFDDDPMVNSMKIDISKISSWDNYCLRGDEYLDVK